MSRGAPRPTAKRRHGATAAQARRRSQRRASKRALALAAALQAPWPEPPSPKRRR